MNRRLCSLAFASCCLIWSTAVFATTLIKSDSVYDFNGEEIQFLNEAILIALDTLPDAESQKWSSPNSDSNGIVTILRSYEADSKYCRELGFLNKRNGYSDQFSIIFCREDNYQWNKRTYHTN